MKTKAKERLDKENERFSQDMMEAYKKRMDTRYNNFSRAKHGTAEKKEMMDAVDEDMIARGEDGYYDISDAERAKKRSKRAKNSKRMEMLREALSKMQAK